MRCNERPHRDIVPKTGFGTSGGSAIIAVVLVMLSLSIMGMAIVGLVSNQQEIWMNQIYKDRAFYATQSGLEYAMHAIRNGYYPVQTNRDIGGAWFTTSIYAANKSVTVTGDSGGSVLVRQVHSASVHGQLMAADCVEIDTSGTILRGMSENVLWNIQVIKTCLNAVNIDHIVVTWSPDMWERVQVVAIDSTAVYTGTPGSRSGDEIDIQDWRFEIRAPLNVISFDSPMTGREITVKLVFTDTSEAVSQTMVF